MIFIFIHTVLSRPGILPRHQSCRWRTCKAILFMLMYYLIPSFSLCKSSCFRESNSPCLCLIFISEINIKNARHPQNGIFIIKNGLCLSLNYNSTSSLINKSFQRLLSSPHPLRPESQTSSGLTNLFGYFFLHVCQMFLHIA